MDKVYGTVITAAGTALVTDCLLNGGKLAVTQAAAGDGGGTYYRPVNSQTVLRGECWRGGIASVQRSPDVTNMLDVKIVIPEDVGGFMVRELGLFDDAGTMIAVCNTPDTEKVAISKGVSGKLTMVMHIIVADASVLQFAITPSLDCISQDELDAAIAGHWHKQSYVTHDEEGSIHRFGLDNIGVYLELFEDADAATGAVGGSGYTLPVADEDTLGGIKASDSLVVDADGTAHAVIGQDSFATDAEVSKMLDEVFGEMQI